MDRLPFEAEAGANKRSTKTQEPILTMRVSETTAVRTGEELDLDAIAKYLRTHLPDPPAGDLRLEQFPGGHSNLTYLLTIGEDEFVLRRPPIGPVAPSAHDMPREFRLLAAIHPQFPLAPRPVVLCEDTSVIGVPFYLMERRKGFIVRSRVPAEIDEHLEWRRRVSENVVDTLVALHSVDVYSMGIINLGKPEGFVARQVHGWADRWGRSRTSDVPEMEQAIEWLSTRIPEGSASDAAIVHNDFKLDNIMLGNDDPSHVVAVLDWEMCAIGDPLIDVGLFLTYWTMEGTDAASTLRAITNGPGWLTRDEVVSRYADATGKDLSHIRFYEVFARFKIAVVIQQIYFRYVKKQTGDERFKNFDQLVLALARDAAHLISVGASRSQ